MPIAAGAWSSWQVRTFPDGSGRWVTPTAAQALRVFGSFENGDVWDTYNAGLSGNTLSARLEFPPDSITSVAEGGEIIVCRGRPWVRDGARWTALSLADSVGVVTAAAGSGSSGSTLTLASATGAIYQRTGGGALRRIGLFPDATVRRFLGVTAETVRILLSDGRVVTLDGTWTTAPMRASVACHAGANLGYAIESGTLHLWKTDDGGRTWAEVGDALATPNLPSGRPAHAASRSTPTGAG